MSADALSQEEIDALLKGAGGGSQETVEAGPLEAARAAAVEEYADRMAATHGEMIGTFLATEARVTRGEPERIAARELAEKAGKTSVLCQFNYSGGLKGPSALVFRETDAAKIGGTMVGDPEAAEFSDMVADAFKEVINTILGNLSSGLASRAGRTVSTGQLEVGKSESSAESFSEASGGDDPFVMVPYMLSVGADLKSEFWQIFSEKLTASLEELSAMPAAPKGGAATVSPSASPVHAAPVEFETLTDEPRTSAPTNLNLIMDIGLGVRVELGRTRMKIRDILNLGSGSVVELDKLAGEPVDLLVNDVIFAKGEVVVIDENFGVRITDILSLNDRIKTLGERKV